MPAELVAIPVLAPVETVWMAAELVATPLALVTAAVETAWIPEALVAMPVLAPVETA